MPFNRSSPPEQSILFLRIMIDYSSETTFYSAYIPETDGKNDIAVFLANNPNYPIVDMNRQIGSSSAPIGQSNAPMSIDFRFSGAVYIYTEEPFPDSMQEQLSNEFKAKGATVHFRSTLYAEAKWNEMKLAHKSIDLYKLDGGNPPNIIPVLLPAKHKQ